MGVDDKYRRLEVGAWFIAEPANDGHSAVVAIMFDELLPAQVMVQVDLVPRFVESADAIGRGFDPECIGVGTEELNSPTRVVVQEQNAAADGQVRLESMAQRPVNTALEGPNGSMSSGSTRVIIQDWINSFNRRNKQAFLHPARSAQRESNPHVRRGKATGCRYIIGTAFRRRIVKEL